MSNDPESLLQAAYADLEKGYTVRAGTRLRQAADTGTPRAMSKLAEMILTKRVPGSAHEIRSRLETISDPTAEIARLRCGLRYDGIGAAADPVGALCDLNLSANKGNPSSMAEIALLWNELGTDQGSHALRAWLSRLIKGSRGSPEGIRHFLEAAIQLDCDETLSPPPPLEAWPPFVDTRPSRLRISMEPEIYTTPEFLSALECAWLRDAASPFLTESRIFDAATGTTRRDSMRTSDAMYFSPVNQSPLTRRIIGKMLSSVGHEAAHAEPLAILRYRPGQEYKPHYDWLNRKSLEQDPLKEAGQRISTVLVYLNNPESGGHTVFPRLTLDVCPKQGDLLYFSNLDARGQPARESLHAGMPVIEGEKWISSLWIRQNRIRF